MSVSDVGDDYRIGVDAFGKSLHLTFMGDSGLDHGKSRVVINLPHRQWHSYLRIETAGTPGYV